MRPRDFEIMLSIRIVYDPNEFFVETYFVFLNPYSQSRASKTVGVTPKEARLCQSL